jgi:ferritin-like metal-binding protein YciE
MLRGQRCQSKKNLRELFHDTLKDIYFAEKKILGALPKMAKAAQSEAKGAGEISAIVDRKCLA